MITPPPERDRREPEAIGAERGAQPGLHRPAVVEQTDVHEREHIGRNRERQHQRPVEVPPPGKFAGGHEPGERGAEHEHAEADAEHEHHGVAQQLREYGFGDVAPDVGRGREPRQRHHQDRRRHRKRDRQARQPPAAHIDVEPGGNASFDWEISPIGFGVDSHYSREASDGDF